MELNLGLQIGTELISCGKRRGEKMAGLGWRAKVTGVRFLSKARLLEFIETKGPIPKAPSSGEAYLLFEFDEVSAIQNLELDAVHKKHRRGSEYMPVRVSWGRCWRGSKGIGCGGSLVAPSGLEEWVVCECRALPRAIVVCLVGARWGQSQREVLWFARNGFLIGSRVFR